MIPATITDYLLSQNENFHRPLLKIAEFISNNFPELDARLSHGVPFYYHKKRVLYLVVLKKEKIRLGFCRGIELLEYGILFSGNGKVVSYFDFQKEEEVDCDKLKACIQLALELDEKKIKTVKDL